MKKVAYRVALIHIGPFAARRTTRENWHRIVQTVSVFSNALGIFS